MKLLMLCLIIALLIFSSGCLKPIKVSVNFLNKTYTFDFNIGFANETSTNTTSNTSKKS